MPKTTVCPIHSTLPQASIAHGYAERPAARDGDVTMPKWISTGTWEIGDRGARHPATYHARAPYDPKMERLEESPEIGDARATIPLADV